MDNQSMSMSVEECWHHVKQTGFGSLTTPDLQISYLPFAFEHKQIALSHFARTNPHWEYITETDCVISMLGPHTYISADYYSKKPAVPTWNYAAVNIWGTARLIPQAQILTSLNTMLNAFAPTLKKDRDMFPQSLLEMLSQHIVGIEVEIHRICGKLKLGQHKSLEDQHKVYNVLHQGSLAEQTYAAFSKQWLKQFRAIDIQPDSSCSK